MDILNDLGRLVPLGCFRVDSSVFFLPSPEPVAPDGWNWLPPGLFPQPWEWLERLAFSNTIRLTYKFSSGESLKRYSFVRVYVVPQDVYKSAGNHKHAFFQLLQIVDNSIQFWNASSEEREKPFQKLACSGLTKTLAQIYNDIKSPTGHVDEPSLSREDNNSFQTIASNAIPGLISQLYPYQIRTVQDMFLREIQPQQMLDSRFVLITGATGANLYFDLINCRFWKHPVYSGIPKGGILGEEMGTGKTCEMLSLILATLDQMPRNLGELTMRRIQSCSVPRHSTLTTLQDLAARCIQTNAIPYRWAWDNLSISCQHQLQGYRPFYRLSPVQRQGRAREVRSSPAKEVVRDLEGDESNKVLLSHGTLVVVPDTLVSQWRHEVTKHIDQDTLRVLIIANNGNREKDLMPTPANLVWYDMVIISHSRFSAEEAKIGMKQPCNCSYAGRSRSVICKCPPAVNYISPLTSIHWKRLVVDEGHSMSASHTKAVRFAATLRVERKWIVSGTPSRGLVGASADGQEGTQDERGDLDKLCATIVDFLGLQTLNKGTWKKLISRPFLERALGAEQVVSTLLNSLVVRNRQTDIQLDIVMPPLTKKTIIVHATPENAISQNLFNALIAINAVTSQRVDQDCELSPHPLKGKLMKIDFFHKKQAGPLQAVVRNLLVSTFYWTGTSVSVIESALKVASEARKVHGQSYDYADSRLLDASIDILESAMANQLWRRVSETHEMAYYVDGSPPSSLTEYYALVGSNPEILGGTAITDAQRVVRDALLKGKTQDVTNEEYLEHSLLSSGIRAKARREAEDRILLQKARVTLEKVDRKLDPSAQGDMGSLDDRLQDTMHKQAIVRVGRKFVANRNQQIKKAEKEVELAGTELVSGKNIQKLRSAREMSETPPQITSSSDLHETYLERQHMLNEASALALLRIVGTSSAKLNYLLTQIQQYSKEEKIIVFSDFVDHTYHLAEALDIIGIPYLLYTSRLKPALKNRYVLTFNTSESFRVMIMDLQLAARGLNLSTASRVYFVQQCWSGATESQAIKRAHRMGQTKPVKVEILVLAGSIEEAMHDRRTNMTGQEIGNTKTLTDDHILRSVIKEPRFLELPKKRQELDPSFPLFTLGDQMGSGEEGLMALETDTRLNGFAPVQKTRQLPLDSDSIKTPSEDVAAKSHKRTAEQSLRRSDKKARIKDDDDEYVVNRKKNKAKKVVWNLP